MPTCTHDIELKMLHLSVMLPSFHFSKSVTFLTFLLKNSVITLSYICVRTISTEFEVSEFELTPI